MDFHITAISYGDAPAGWPAGGTPSISGYTGDPLYWHVATDNKGGVVISVNQQTPNSTDGTTGPVSQVVFDYTAPSPGSSPQQMKWLNPGVQFDGNRLLMNLRLLGGEDKGDAILGIAKEPDFGPPGPDPTKPGSLGLIILGPAVTGDAPRAYFVNVPIIHRAAATTGRMKFPDPGSMGGPIGSVNVP